MNIPKIKRNPRFLLMYSPLWFDKRFGAVKPEGSLGLIYLAGTLKKNGHDVTILDCAVGNDKYSLQDTFFREVEQPNGMRRVGMTLEQILTEVEGFDVIGISSIFTAQTTMVKEVVEAIAKHCPGKLIILGGVNARSQQKLFFDAGAHIIATSEAEGTLLQIAEQIRAGNLNLRLVNGIAYRENGEIKTTLPVVLENLDALPVPQWDMQPLEKYWKIARPHGGGVSKETLFKYAPVMTSRGCIYKCTFCHIANELAGSESGNLRKLRLKTHERVMREIRILKDLGVRDIYLEDDSLLGYKKRMMGILREIISLNLRLNGVNGINISHLCTTNNKPGVDHELLELMAEAGFQKMMLPVESGSRRIIKEYATDKLDLDKHDIVGLIKKVKALGMQVGGNYTFGYPDETLEEVNSTFKIAKVHMAAGLDNANFMIITPFPGTPLYDRVVRENLFLPETKIEFLDWTKVAIKTLVPKEHLECMITKGWESINKPERVARIREMSEVPTE